MKKIIILFLSILWMGAPSKAQETPDSVTTDSIRITMKRDTLEWTRDSAGNIEYKTWETPIITDDMTVDPELNKAWREGKSSYSAKPKHMWELGVHFGHFFIDGDVDRTIPGGYGVGLHLRRAIHYVFSIRLEAFYGQAWGLDPQPWRHSSLGGGLVEDVFQPYGEANSDGVWFPSHKTTNVYGAAQIVINIGNLLFHKERNRWNWYALVGAGLNHHAAMLDMLDSNGDPYTDLINATSYTEDLFDTRSGRLDIKDDLRNIYDGDYETEGFKKRGIFRIGDETNIHVLWTAGMGIARKISKRFNIGLEHQVLLADNDYWDGIKFRTAGDQTNNVDVGHYTSLRLAFNLGNFNKRVEPLYWLNPMDAAFADIAALKRRPVIDTTDTDGDNIIDIFDLEINSPRYAIVDVRGITLDSDGDGFYDHEDCEPYSMPRYEVDSCGAAILPFWNSDSSRNFYNKVINIDGKEGCCRDWFLPMIHFDLNDYCIEVEYYPQLHHLATVMKSNPDICITAFGHADARNKSDYNMVLSYKRAKSAIDFMVNKYDISRERFKLMYGGEDVPLVGDDVKLKDSQQYLNRRVEFRICEPDDKDMERPEGPDAGKCDNDPRVPDDEYSPGPKTSGH
jgi:hypothetical protein